MPKLVNGLTQKMKNFCVAYLETGNATEAYLKAYDSTSVRTAANESGKLLRRDDITAYIAELNKPTINKITNERERKRAILWKGIERCFEKGDEASTARYMDILNKMDSEYVNINRNFDESVEKLTSLDTEQLKQLLQEKPESTEE